MAQPSPQVLLGRVTYVVWKLPAAMGKTTYSLRPLESSMTVMLCFDPSPPSITGQLRHVVVALTVRFVVIDIPLGFVAMSGDDS